MKRGSSLLLVPLLLCSCQQEPVTCTWAEAWITWAAMPDSTISSTNLK